MNLVIESGRVGKFANIKEVDTKKGKMKLANFSLIATGGGAFIPCVAWGKTAEVFEKYVSEGNPIEVVGHWTTNIYEKDGHKIYQEKCTVDRLIFPPTGENRKPNDGGESGKEEFMQIPDDIASEFPFN